VDGRLRLAAIRNSVGGLLTQWRELKSASEMYYTALELAKPEATSLHPNERARYSTADSCAGLAEIEATLAGTRGLSRGKRIEHWTQATSSDERSLQIWAQVKEPGFSAQMDSIASHRRLSLNGSPSTRRYLCRSRLF
jgi:hypothetical protein